MKPKHRNDSPKNHKQEIGSSVYVKGHIGIIPKFHAKENLGEYGAEIFKGSTKEESGNEDGKIILLFDLAKYQR